MFGLGKANGTDEDVRVLHDGPLANVLWLDLSVPVDVKGPATPEDEARLVLLGVARRPAVIGALVLLIGGIVAMVSTTKKLRATGDDMQTQITALKKETREREVAMKQVDSLIKQRKEVEQKNAEVRRVDDNRFALPRLMNDLATGWPHSSWITALTVEHEDPDTRNLTVKLEGYAPTTSDVNDIIAKLNSSPFLTGATLRSASNVTVSRQSVVKFEVGIETQIADQTFYDTDTLRVGGAPKPVSWVPSGAKSANGPVNAPMSMGPVGPSGAVNGATANGGRP